MAQKFLSAEKKKEHSTQNFVSSKNILRKEDKLKTFSDK